MNKKTIFTILTMCLILTSIFSTCFSVTAANTLETNVEVDHSTDNPKNSLKTIVVPDDYSTIQDAIDAASDGDIIQVREGTYRENIIIWDKQLTIEPAEPVDPVEDEDDGDDDIVVVFPGQGPDDVAVDQEEVSGGLDPIPSTPDGSSDDPDDPRFLDDGLDQYQLYGDGILFAIGYVQWLAQSFVPSHPTLAMVKLLMSKFDPTGRLYLKIRSSLKGSDLTSCYVDASDFAEDNSQDWICFDFPDIAVIPGETYYIVLCSPGDENAQWNYWWDIETEWGPQSYPLGGGYVSIDNGLTWHDPFMFSEGEDFGFKTYFCPPAEQIDQIQTKVTEGHSSALFVGARGSRWLAQSFKPSFTTLTKMDLEICEWDEASADLVVKIRRNLNGPDLITASRHLMGGPMIWPQVITFDFPDIEVTPGEQYYIIFCSPEGGTTTRDLWSWAINEYSDTYGYGESYRSDDGGVTWYELDEIDHPYYDFWFRTYGYNGYPPSKPDKPSGQTSGKAGTEYTYTSSTSDPEGDRIKYCFDWGDGTYTWTCYPCSGETTAASHKWNEKGTYNIRVKAKDETGAQSDWSDPLVVSMPTNNQESTNSQPLLRQLLQRLFKNSPDQQSSPTIPPNPAAGEAQRTSSLLEQLIRLFQSFKNY